MTIEEYANSLTSEQYIKLIEFAYGPISAEIRNMTDDQLLEALGA